MLRRGVQSATPSSSPGVAPFSGIVPAVLLAVACAVAATWVAASSPRDTLLCNYIHPDCLGNHWLMVWVAEQLMQGRSILHNDTYYWPVGDAPWLAGNGSEGFAYLPLHAVLGWPLGSNVYLIGVLVLNGLSGWALARAAGARPAAALAACPTTTLSLYTMQELGAGRFSQVSICWLGFFLASWLRLLDAPSSGRALVSGVLLALTSLFYWYYGLFGVLAGAVLLIARGRLLFLAGPLVEPSSALEGPRPLKDAWRSLAVFSATYLVLVVPLLWVYLRYWASIPGTGEEQFPHPQALGDSTWPGIPFLVTGGRHSGRALPFTTVLFAVIGLAHARRRSAWGLFGVAVLFAGLMAGALIPNGPYTWVYGLARPLQRFWWPYRHVAVLNLALTALAALGVDRLIAGRRWEKAAGLGVALAIPLQLHLQGAPWHAQFSRVIAPEPFYEKVGKLPGKRMIEPPLSPAVASSETPLIYQLYHHKQLVNGHAEWVDRVRPDAWDAFVAGNSFLTEMQALERGKVSGPFTFKGEDLQALLDQDVRVMVLNREYFPVAFSPLVSSYGSVFEALFGLPVVTGKRTRAWDMTLWNGKTEVLFPAFVWPAGVQPGGPDLSIQGMHETSLGFSMPPMAPMAPRRDAGRH